MIHEIQNTLEAELDKSGPGAAIAVARGGEIIHTSAHGLANLEWEKQIQPNTIFRIGSLTKQFTAVAIMLLEERGSLSIDAPISEFISKAPTEYSPILLRHLLTHTAGIPNYTDIPGFWTEHSRQSVTPEGASAYFMSLPLKFPAGEKFMYSNSGYLLLGRVIEVVSGQSYGEFLRDEIFRPLGMNSTDYLDAAPIIKNRASGYVRADTGFQNAPGLSMTWPYASGALGSSVVDLIRWQSALTAGEVIKSESLDLMHQPATLADGSPCPYGMGWMIGYRNGNRYVHHSGSIRGFASHMAWFPEQDVCTVVLSNLQSFDAEKFDHKIAELALGPRSSNSRGIP